ncbi:MAG: Maf-like protein [Methylophilaceae bacterium]|jgi:septum formation protein|nr:Maf-like protein [Methylophilaceae bacterium]
MKPQLILASSSIYRRELLERLQLSFSVVVPNVDETPLPDEKPEETALRLAQVKARKIGDLHPNALVIGCDQVATLDGLQLGKPLTHDNAVKQLTLMRGRTVFFHSALCLFNAASGNMQAEDVIYEVRFRQLTDAQIENYLRLEQPYHCAGSAKSEGLGIALMEYMRGDDPNALIGLPLISLISMLQKEGVSVI